MSLNNSGEVETKKSPLALMPNPVLGQLFELQPLLAGDVLVARELRGAAGLLCSVSLTACGSWLSKAMSRNVSHCGKCLLRLRLFWCQLRRREGGSEGWGDEWREGGREGWWKRVRDWSGGTHRTSLMCDPFWATLLLCYWLDGIGELRIICQRLTKRA